MEQEVMNYIFNYIKALKIKDCDVFLNRPTIVGDQEKLKGAYVVISFPNGFDNQGAFYKATGIIAIGAKDRVIGLPQVKAITKISDILKGCFPILTEDYSFLDYEFSSDDSLGNGWHEYYYSFQLYINKSN